jgi:starvation-inducible DNA-binding protein
MTIIHLEETIKKLLATAYVFQLKAQYFHWSVEGPHFHSYHAFLGELYSDVFNSCDDIAEHIRALDMYAPGSLTRFAELSAIKDQLLVPRAELMIEELLEDNHTIIHLLEESYNQAGDHLGLQNFLQDRIAAHEKWSWKMRSITKISRA